MTGILGEIPANSHFHFDLMADFETAKEVLGEQRYKDWFWFDIQTYLLINDGENVNSFEGRLNDIIEKNVSEKYASFFDLVLQPLTSIHLESNLKDELEKNSDIKYSYIMLTVAGFIIIMACINFMNLTTANYSTRLTEIGVRKVFGAQKSQLVKQYLTESVLLTLMAFFLSLILVLVTLPYFNELTGKGMTLFSQENLNLFGLLLLFVVMVGLISGSYPAFYLSGLKPIFAMKNNTGPGKRAKWFRNMLVTIQISISLVLIISTLIVSGQLDYFNQTTFGFDKEYMVIIPVKDRSKNKQHELLVNRFKQSPHVINATFTSSIPGSSNSMSFYFKAAKSEKDPQRIANFLIDDEFLNTFNLEVLEGEDLLISGREDTIGYAFINEAFVKFFDMKDPVGSFIDGNNRNKVIKVVKDFNVKSLHHEMEPVIMLYSSNWFRHIAVKVSGSNISAAMDHLSTEYTNFYTGYPFDYSFLDDDIALQYETEQKLSTLFKIFPRGHKIDAIHTKLGQFRRQT